MLESIRKVWKIEDLRKKLIYTFLMLLLYRLVGVIPAPGVDAAKVMSSAASDLPLLELVNMMTGNAFSQMTIMAMGITPYINASIIMQLLTIAIPALERMSRDEEGGREKIQRISRYVTVALAAVQAIGLVAGLGYIKAGWLNYVLVGVSMAGGTALAMWIGERITDKGVGNGISLLIFAGIISNLFNGIISLFSTAITTGTASAWIAALSIIIVALVMTVVVTFI
ncbi:MAG: preprotein translocase subunit SecY, partial [Clostridia bacterium]|nr:preprotein translocase subunit SecY [Clostridia bacterium]